MGLSISVGRLAEHLKKDAKDAEWIKKQLQQLNNLLSEDGLPAHVEPENLPQLNNRAKHSGYPYSFLHYLRRFAAHVSANPQWQPVPFPEHEDPAEDAVVADESSNFASHLLCHSDCEGFYVPIDFPEPLFDQSEEVAGGIVGSSQALLRELIDIAAPLGISLVGKELTDAEVARVLSRIEAGEFFTKERIAWLSLFEAARLSVEHSTVISFG